MIIKIRGTQQKDSEAFQKFDRLLYSHIFLREVNSILVNKGQQKKSQSSLPFQVIEKSSSFFPFQYQRPVSWADGDFCSLMSAENKRELNLSVQKFNENQNKLLKSPHPLEVKKIMIEFLAGDDPERKKQIQKQIQQFDANVSEKSDFGLEGSSFKNEHPLYSSRNIAPLSLASELAQQNDKKCLQLLYCVSYQNENEKTFSQFLQQAQINMQQFINLNQFDKDSIAMVLIFDNMGGLPNFISDFYKLKDNDKWVKNDEILLIQQKMMLEGEFDHFTVFSFFVERKMDYVSLKRFVFGKICQHFDPEFFFITDFKHQPSTHGLQLQINILGSQNQLQKNQKKASPKSQVVGVTGQYASAQIQNYTLSQRSLRLEENVSYYLEIDQIVGRNQVFPFFGSMIKWPLIKHLLIQDLLSIQERQKNDTQILNTSEDKLNIHNINQDYMGLLFQELNQSHNSGYSQVKLQYLNEEMGQIIDEDSISTKSLIKTFKEYNNHNYSSSFIVACRFINFQRIQSKLMFIGVMCSWIHHSLQVIQKQLKLTIIIYVIYYSSQKFSEQIQLKSSGDRYSIYIPQFNVFFFLLCFTSILVLIMQIRLNDQLYVPVITYQGLIGFYFTLDKKKENQLIGLNKKQGQQQNKFQFGYESGILVAKFCTQYKHEFVDMQNGLPFNRYEIQLSLYSVKKEHSSINQNLNDPSFKILTIKLYDDISKRYFVAKEQIKFQHKMTLIEPFHYTQVVSLTFTEDKDFGLCEVIRPYTIILYILNGMNTFILLWTIIFYYLQSEIFQFPTTIALIILGVFYIMMFMINLLKERKNKKPNYLHFIIDTITLSINYFESQILMQTQAFMNMDVDSQGNCVEDLYQNQVSFAGKWIFMNAFLSFIFVTIGQYFDDKGYLLFTIGCFSIASFGIQVFFGAVHLIYYSTRGTIQKTFIQEKPVQDWLVQQRNKNQEYLQVNLLNNENFSKSQINMKKSVIQRHHISKFVKQPLPSIREEHFKENYEPQDSLSSSDDVENPMRSSIIDLGEQDQQVQFPQLKVTLIPLIIGPIVESNMLKQKFLSDIYPQDSTIQGNKSQLPLPLSVGPKVQSDMVIQKHLSDILPQQSVIQAPKSLILPSRFIGIPFYSSIYNNCESPHDKKYMDKLQQYSGNSQQQHNGQKLKQTDQNPDHNGDINQNIQQQEDLFGINQKRSMFQKVGKKSYPSGEPPSMSP